MNRAFTGDCRDVLRELIAQGVRVQCVVTSPPYWGLRDYGIPPSVWGGDPSCAHEWGPELSWHKGGPHGDGVLLEGGRSVVEAQAACKDVRAGQFCVKCGAWFGCFGLEPTYMMYVEHAVEVFRLVWQVLADDGILWLNLGDTYHNGDKAGYAKDRIKAEDSMQRKNLGANFIGAPNRIPQPGLKNKDLVGIPWRVAFALQADGWWLRQDNIWHKKNPMPESVRDRTTRAHEYVFHLTKSEKYYYDANAIKEPSSPETHPRLARAHDGYAPPGQDNHEGLLSPRPNRNGVNPKTRIPSGWDTRNGSHREKLGRYANFNVKQNESFAAATSCQVVENRNKRSVWPIPTAPYPEAHFATFPPALVEPCILAGSRGGDIVLDPFAGSGTVGEVAQRLGRKWILIDISPDYAPMQRERTMQPGLEL